MITKDQLEILRDMLSECDEDWLLAHLSIAPTGHCSFSVEFFDSNEQDVEELLGK